MIFFNIILHPEGLYIWFYDFIKHFISILKQSSHPGLSRGQEWQQGFAILIYSVN